MIQGIDIFAPRDNGLPDFTRITPAQIFNGSVAASLNSMKDSDPFGLSGEKGFSGTPESPWKTTTIDRRTGKRVEVRKASVVEELLNGEAPRKRGKTKANTGSSGGGYSAPNYNEPPPLPEDTLPNSESQVNPSLLEVPNNWHPPMSPDYQPPYVQPAGDDQIGGDSLFPPLELSPQEKKSAALRKLPVMLLEELKNLHLV